MNLAEKIIGFHQRYRPAGHLIFWFFLLLLQYSSASYFNSDTVPFRDKLLAVGTNELAQIGGAYFLTYFIIPRYIYQQKYITAFGWFAVCVYIICVLSPAGSGACRRAVLRSKSLNPKETYTEIFTDLPKLVYVYFFRIFSVAFVFMLLKVLKETQLAVQSHERCHWKKQKAEAELKLLKAQLNLHFLFNTLNNIYALALINSRVTASAIGRLSEILDYILYRCDSRYVPLSGEIALLNNYIGLEKLRYDERLRVSLKCQVDGSVQIAPLILLSIVENAFKHGAGDDMGNPAINIELKTDRRNFEFTVSNSFQPKAMAKSTNIGLPNLKQQLELIYPEQHQLTITETDSLFIVKLSLDLP